MSYTQSDINHALQIVMNAINTGRDPTDTAGMDSDDEAWYQEKEGKDIDSLIIHLYKQIRESKKTRKTNSKSKRKNKSKSKRKNKSKSKLFNSREARKSKRKNK
jgi:hypothetical protein